MTWRPTRSVPHEHPIHRDFVRAAPEGGHHAAQGVLRHDAGPEALRLKTAWGSVGDGGATYRSLCHLPVIPYILSSVCLLKRVGQLLLPCFFGCG